jgi:hypothetical protein
MGAHASERLQSKTWCVEYERVMHNPNFQLLVDAAKLLEPILDELVFVGGCATGLLIRTVNSNDFTRLDFLDGQSAGGKVLAQVLEAIGRRMENHDGDIATLHILLVANIRIDRNQHIKFRFGRRQKLAILLS